MEIRNVHSKMGRLLRVALFSVMLLAVASSIAQADADQRWVKRYSGPGNDVDAGAVLAFDKWGNVYVAGKSANGTHREDYILIKYGPDGSVKWTARYDGPAHGWDGVKGLAVDGDGNVYVTGRSFGSGTHADYATIKYDGAGQEKWVRRFSSPGEYDDGAMDLALDSYGNVIVTGFSTGDGSGFDFVTIKYGPDGSTKWVQRYDGPAGGGDVGRAVVVDADNNVYVTGPSKGSGSDWDFGIVKYSGAGQQLWARRWNGSANWNDGSTDLALDKYGFVYATGYSYKSGDDCDYVTVKYNPSGDLKWVRTYDGPAGGPDVAWAIAIDDNGVYVTGQSQGKGTGADFATIRYTRGGDQTFLKRYSGPARGTDVANAIAAAEGMVYVTGFSTGAHTEGDYMTRAYGAGGGYKWADRYDGPGTGFDQGNAVGVSAVTGNVYVTGGSVGTGTGPDVTTIKYAP